MQLNTSPNLPFTRHHMMQWSSPLTILTYLLDYHAIKERTALSYIKSLIYSLRQQQKTTGYREGQRKWGHDKATPITPIPRLPLPNGSVISAHPNVPWPIFASFSYLITSSQKGNSRSSWYATLLMVLQRLSPSLLPGVISWPASVSWKSSPKAKVDTRTIKQQSLSKSYYSLSSYL